MNTIIFDFDGTLADTLELTRRLFNQVAPHYNLPAIEVADVKALRSLSARELLARFKLSPWRLGKLVTEVQKLMKAQMSTVELVPGLAAVIRAARAQGWQVGIVTSNSRVNVEGFLAHHPAVKIDFIHAEKNLFGKARVLKKCLRQRQLASETVWYVGDEVRDIEAAQEAGVRAIGVGWGFNSVERLQQAEPTKLVIEPSQLLALLAELS